MADHLVIGGALRIASGIAIAAIAGALLRLGWGLEWGVRWAAWVPAFVLMLPAVSLVRRIRLELDGPFLEVITGWLWRRGWRIRLADLTVELVPTAGLWAVVLHRGEHSYPVATWVRRRRAETIAAWLDAAAPQGRWPRREAPARDA